MNWKDWLLPWRAKAKIEELQACLNRSVDAAPFTAKINLLEDRLEQTIKSLKAALDEKHACATLLSSTRASEQDWRETASKIDLEKNELASLNRTLVDQLEHAKADVEEWKGRVKVERKEREDVEKAIGGMKAEVLEAQTLAAKASKLQEALDHEIAEHRLAKEQVVGLTKWIRVAHRLDSPSPKGTIRRILQSARFRTTSRSGTVTAMALLCFAWTALGQAPFWRNPWSTNQAPPVIGTNLWISNTASGDGWFFFNQPNSNVVARLRDITAATASGTNFNGINVTNRALIGDLVVTNSGNTTNLTNWDMQTWKVQNNLGAFDNLELDVSSGLAQPSWTLGYANSEPTILGQVLVGNGNDVNGGNSTVVGISNYVSNTKTHIVVGSFDQAWGGQDGVVGHDSLVTNAYNFAFGNHITNITTESVEIGPSDSNKVRISELGLNSLNLPMVSTNTTNFGALVFPPAATALSTNGELGSWTASVSNGVLNILSPVGGSGLMGIRVHTNDGGNITAKGIYSPTEPLYLGPLPGSVRWGLDTVRIYPTLPWAYDIGLPASAVRSIFSSNLYAANAVISNGLTLPFASDYPTAASLVNRSALFNSNNVTFLENSYDGVNVNAWQFRTNGTTETPGGIQSGGSVFATYNLYAGDVFGLTWSMAGDAPEIKHIGNGVSLLPGIGLATNAFQVCGTNNTPSFAVMSNGYVGICLADGSTATAQSVLDVDNRNGGAASNIFFNTGSNASLTLSAKNLTGQHLSFGIEGFQQTWIQSQHDNGVVGAITLNPIGGNVGIGTNNPQAALHVQGAQAELLRVDTISGGTGALTVSSNPVVRIRTEQATNQPLGCYGAMMMPLTNILAIGPTAYTNINGYSVLNTNWFRCNTNTGTISNVFAGYYRMTISASILGGNNEALEGCLLTNGVDSECISFYKVYDAASRFDVLSASGLLYLPTNCQCSFGLKTTTAGNVAIRRASIVIGTP